MGQAAMETYSRELGLDIRNLEPIQENAYCRIYRAELEGHPVALKKYRGDDPRLVRLEAESLDFYHQIAKDDSDLIDSGTIRLREADNIICIAWVHGEAFSDFLHRTRSDTRMRERSVRLTRVLGALLRRLYRLTVDTGAETDPFMFEYLEHCSTRLESLPLLGPLVFRNLRDSARRLSNEYREARIAPSFVHGDFVFKNIHVDGERLGLIDFANTIRRSHVLNDVYNLRFALANMMLPAAYKHRLWDGFTQGLGDLEFPMAAHRFYHEFHRRRWLMLKLRTQNPLCWLQAARGICTFARPFSTRSPAS